MTAATLDLVFSALADSTRRSILSRLREGSATARELAAPFAMSWSAVSQHLKVLERAGLISRTVRAQWRVIDLCTDPLDDAAQWIDTHRRDWNERFDLLEERLCTLEQEENGD